MTHFLDANAGFEPPCAALSQVKGAYFAVARKGVHDKSRDLLAEQRVKKRLDKAYEDDHRFGGAVHEALKALLEVGALRLSALVRKIQFMTRHKCDDECVEPILSDLRSLIAGN